MADKLKIKVILASTREGRQGEKIAQWVMDQAKSNDALELELIDLATVDLPYELTGKMPGMRAEGEYPNEQIAAWGKTVAASDGFIIVTPEYNHGYPASIKNALDQLQREWIQKPVGFVGYSGSLGGGVRAIEQLIQVVVQLAMHVVTPAVAIHESVFGFDASKHHEGPLADTLARMLTRLADSATIYRTVRSK